MPTAQPHISILLPVYNDSRYLRRAVLSLRRQSFPDWELLLLDDGSTDQTAELADAFQIEDARIRSFHFSHNGIAGTLNAGLGFARGRLIARMDADDISHVHRLGLQKGFLEDHPDICAVGCRVRIFPRRGITTGMLVYEKWINSLVSPEEISREIFVDAPLVHPSILARKEDLEAVGGYRPEGPEDFDLWLRLHLQGKRFAKIPRVLFFWMDRPERSTRSLPVYERDAFRRLKAIRLAQWLGPGRRILLAGKREAKRLGKLLEAEGLRIQAYVDIDRQRIGTRWRGIPVIPYERLTEESYSGCMLLAAVGARGARNEVRVRLEAFGLRESEDFVCIA